MYVNPIKLLYISIDDILVGLAVVFIVSVAIMVISYLILRYTAAKNNKLPVERKSASIIDLRQESALLGIVSETWILFEFADGGRIRLATDMKNDFMAGDSGILKYQGDRLISFERGDLKEIDSEAMIPLPKIEVTEEEIRYVMEKKNIPYAEAASLVKEIKLKQWEKRREKKQ